jgi:hypothetical protein
MDRLRHVAHSCGFTLESLPREFASGITIQRFTKLIEGQPFMLDALQVSRPIEAVWAGRLQASFEGGVVRVVSREGLISLKVSAGRPQDIADVQRLEELGRG